EEQPLGARICARGGDDLVDLHLRQLPVPKRSLGLGKLLETRRCLDGGASKTDGRTARRRQPCRCVAERSGVSPSSSFFDASQRERLPRSGEALDSRELLDQPPCLGAVEARRVELGHDSTQPLARLAYLLEHASPTGGD